MSDLADIKRRMQTVKQTRQITGAMQTVSIAKMRKTGELYENSRAYVNAMNELVGATGGGEYSAPRSKGDDVVVVFSSDRGLCGGFNQYIFKCAEQIITGETIVIPVGQTAVAHYSSHGKLDLSLVHDYAPNKECADKIAKYLLNLYDGGVKSVTVVFCEHGRGENGVKAVKLFPIPEQKSLSSDCINFEPSAEAVASKLIPFYVTSFIYDVLINNISSEHSARHAAMTSATRSADDIIDMLTVTYNRARQSAVTSQITEIIGSTQALKQGGDN